MWKANLLLACNPVLLSLLWLFYCLHLSAVPISDPHFELDVMWLEDMTVILCVLMVFITVISSSAYFRLRGKWNGNGGNSEGSILQTDLQILSLIVASWVSWGFYKSDLSSPCTLIAEAGGVGGDKDLCIFFWSVSVWSSQWIWCKNNTLEIFLPEFILF